MTIESTSDDNETIREIYDTLSEKQKDVVGFLIGAALENAASTILQQVLNDISDLSKKEEKL